MTIKGIFRFIFWLVWLPVFPWVAAFMACADNSRLFSIWLRSVRYGWAKLCTRYLKAPKWKDFWN